MRKSDLFCGVMAILLVVVMAFLLSALSSLVLGAIAMWLWNWLAVSLFGASPVGYWTAVGICFAIGFLKNLIFPSTTVNVKS